MHLLTLEDEKFIITIDFVEVANEKDNKKRFFPLRILPVTLFSSVLRKKFLKGRLSKI